MPHTDFLGWIAAAFMISTFASREARVMRPLAVATNLAFIGYGATADLAPVLTLHLALLPINLWRWSQCTGAHTVLRWSRCVAVLAVLVIGA